MQSANPYDCRIAEAIRGKGKDWGSVISERIYERSGCGSWTPGKWIPLYL
jgi:hypothetical protein